MGAIIAYFPAPTHVVHIVLAPSMHLSRYGEKPWNEKPVSENRGCPLKRSRQFVATSLMALLLALSLVTACGGGKATPTIVPATPTASASAATAITPLLWTPRTSAMSGATAPSGSVGAASRVNVYTDPQGRFTFTIPDGYHQIPNATPAIVVAFAPPIVSGGISLTIQSMEPGATLDLMTTAVRVAASKFPDYQPLTTVPAVTAVAGQPARQFEFMNTENGGRTYHSLATTTIRGKNFYTLSIELEEKDFAANIEQAKVFINSFAFLANG